MRERALIEAIAAALRAPSRRPRVVRWLGDDAAVVRARRVRRHVSIDAMVDGTHFRLGPASPARRRAPRARRRAVGPRRDGRRARARPTSALVLPAALDDADVLALHAGAEALAAETGVTIAGGDLTRGPVLCVAVTVVGWAGAGGPLVGRDGARAGRPRRRHRRARRARPRASRCSRAARRARRRGLVARHLRPRPRLAEGVALAAAGARAMLDLSDGLATDALRLAEASGVRIELDAAAPAARAGRRRGRRARSAWTPAELAATGGEDYELCVCVAPDERARPRRPPPAHLGRRGASRRAGADVAGRAARSRPLARLRALTLERDGGRVLNH